MSMNRLLAWSISRFAALTLFASSLQKDLFVPFLSNPNLDLLDPWSSWVGMQGRLDAFPYGVVMFLFFLPAILLSYILEQLPISIDFSLLIGCTLLVVEYYTLKLVQVFDKVSPKVWSWAVIMSPLPLYISFVHGQIDIIPSLIMLLVSIFLMKNSWVKAGIGFGLVIATKFSFALALPFLILFIVSKKSRKENGIAFAKGMLPGVALLLLPLTFSKGYRLMVLETPEVLRTLDAQIDVGVSSLYLVPIAFLVVFLGYWNLNQLSSLVLVSYIGAAFLVIAVAQTTSVGWFLWGYPLVLFAIRKTSTRTLVLFCLWQTSVTVYFASKQGLFLSQFFEGKQISFAGNGEVLGLIFTVNVVLAAVLVWKILNEALKVGDIYSLSNKPLSVCIAGDSGVGKDTLTNGIANIFVQQEVTLLLGDDYHLYERGETSWQSTTHLSIEANDLEAMGRDFQKLLKRESIFVKHYDHSVGRFTLPRKIKSSQLILVNGLHAHLIPGNQFADLRIFLSMEEELRIKLKLERDKNQRKQVDENLIRTSIETRIPHFEKYVKPQSETADLHFHLKQINVSLLTLGVVASSKDAAFMIEFRNIYNAVSTIPATLSRIDGEVFLEFDTTPFKGSDAHAIFSQLAFELDQVFPVGPHFTDGSTGLMSLLSLSALLRKRRGYVQTP
jgi:uridine kinase